MASQSQHVTAAEQEVEHKECGDQLGQSCAHGGSLDTHVHLRDEDVVEDDVEHTHEDVQCRRDAHVAGALQHGTGKAFHLEEDAGEADEQEVDGGVAGDVGRSAEPEGQLLMYGDTCHGEHKAPEETADERLPEHATGRLEVVGTDEMGYLHGETHIGGRGQSAQEPCGGLDESYGCGGFLAEMAYHGVVDEAHHGGGDLCQDGGDTQADNQTEFLTGSQRPPLADIGQQLVASFCGGQGQSVGQSMPVLPWISGTGLPG